MTTSAVGFARESVPDAQLVEQPQPAAAPALEQPQLQPEAAPVSRVLPVVAKAVRLANVERLRVLAMLEIVRYHDHDDRLPIVGGLGLPTFLLLTALFNCTLTERRGVSKFLADKRERLFLPWVFWSLVYGAIVVVSAMRHGEPISSVLSWQMILAGTSSHLWFVPFAMFSAGLVAGTHLLTRKAPNRLTGLIAMAVGAAVLVALGLMPDVDRPAPIPQWLLSLPSAFFGFALGRLVLAEGNKPAVRDLIPIAIIALAGAVYFEWFQPNMLIWRYCVSLILVFVVFSIPGKLDPISKFLSPLLFGIYLAHHMIGHRLLVKVPFIEHSQYLFLVDFALTALLVRALKETPLKRFI
ncbi:MAG TPA: acyltransferase [Polyangiales bacterium]|nr:acyltransferase [Polyangiales bacterium]